MIAGIVQDRAYFEAEVVPHLDGDRVRYVGSVGPQERDALLGASAALLHLVGLRRALRARDGRGAGMRHAR